MSNRRASSAFTASPRATTAPTHPTILPNPRETGSDPLGSDNIDAQIRWFFENALKSEQLRP
jgi:hypothetical protein